MTLEPYSEDKRKTQLKLLNEVSTQLQGLIHSDEFYSEIVKLISSGLHYFAVQIWSVTDHGTTKLEAQTGAFQNLLKIGQEIPSDQGITGEVIRSSRSYLSNDVHTDPFYRNLAIPVNTRAQITVPILSQGKTIGTLNVESDRLHAFDREDLGVLEVIASQISVAITNRKLFRDAKDFSRKLQVAVDQKTNELRKAHSQILEQQKHLQKENTALKTLVNKDYNDQEIIGSSPALKNLISMVDKIAPTLASVLLQGESGTGKELIARRLHFKSERGDRPFVTVNCGALQETLLESELFGHEKGSFTGAIKQKIGLVETADNGTLFMDEIGEMPLSIQAKLLRFLQEGEFYRIGSKHPLKVDVRVVSATNRDLETEVREGRFREDLYYRLNTITLRIPPLRKRKEDIAGLVDHFLKTSRFGATKEIKKIDPRVIEVFQNYDWPGNIRELQNSVERLKILSESNEIRLEDIPFNIRAPKTRMTESGSASSELSVHLPLEEIEKSHILRTLEYYHGNKTKAAQSLGITIKTLYNKLHSYQILEKGAQSHEKTL